MRDKIKQFAGAAVGPGVPGYPCPPYKVRTARGRIPYPLRLRSDGRPPARR